MSGATTSTRTRTSLTSASEGFGRSSARMRRSKRSGMAATGLLRRRSLEVTWVAFAATNLVAMAIWPSWETIPFHFIWISLTLLYGFRVWRPAATSLTLLAVVTSTGSLILQDAFNGEQLWGELFEVPLMSAMFLAMVWHARRRQEALRVVEHQAEQRASLLERQERFLHDASHELRTPVTIARGHLEVHRRTNGNAAPEIDVALDELKRIELILERLLLLAKADQPDFVVLDQVELEPFLEDVFMRWSEVAPRGWRLGRLAVGKLEVDPEGLRAALDALLENAVKYTEPGEAIELRSRTVAAAFRRTRSRTSGIASRVPTRLARELTAEWASDWRSSTPLPKHTMGVAPSGRTLVGRFLRCASPRFAPLRDNSYETLRASGVVSYRALNGPSYSRVRKEVDQTHASLRRHSRQLRCTHSPRTDARRDRRTRQQLPLLRSRAGGGSFGLDAVGAARPARTSRPCRGTSRCIRRRRRTSR